MDEEKKEGISDPEETDEVKGTEMTEKTDEDMETKATEDAPAEDDALAERRGRLVMAGVVLAVIAAVIAVFVAAVFQLTATLIIPCRGDVAINDPAPILWKKIETPDLPNQPLGVSGKLLSTARFKGITIGTESGSKTE